MPLLQLSDKRFSEIWKPALMVLLEKWPCPTFPIMRRTKRNGRIRKYCCFGGKTNINQCMCNLNELWHIFKTQFHLKRFFSAYISELKKGLFHVNIFCEMENIATALLYLVYLLVLHCSKCSKIGWALHLIRSPLSTANINYLWVFCKIPFVIRALSIFPARPPLFRPQLHCGLFSGQGGNEDSDIEQLFLRVHFLRPLNGAS